LRRTRRHRHRRPPSGGGLEKTTLKVSILPTTDLAPFWLAQDEGYFRAEGLTVESVIAASGQASLTKSISGDADIAFSTYPPFFTARSTGAADINWSPTRRRSTRSPTRSSRSRIRR